jgi:LysR family transcriptional regulator, nitrogen assimilation regulatory protein
MDLRSLRYFVRVVDFGSVTRAAAHLHIVQPALTRHIQRLEKELGVTLLERASRGVKVTGAGELLYKRGTELLREADRLKDELLDHGGHPAGRVVLGITPPACPIFAPPLLQRVRAQFPRIDIQISEAFSRVLSSWLINGDIDVAIISDRDILQGLRTRWIAREELLFLSKPGRGAKSWISADELCATPLILTDGIHKRVEAMLATPLMVDMKLNSVEVILQLVQGGVGVSILPYSAARDEIESGTIQALRIGESGLSRRLALCTSESRRVSTATRIVVETLASVSADLMAAGHFTYRAGVAPKGFRKKTALGSE